jgi:hypothetical protein
MGAFRVFEVYSPLRAGICAPPTVDTLPGRKGDLHFGGLGLGVLTKDTAQGTSLKEDHTADTRAIFKTVPLDINDEGKVIHV